MTSNCLVNINRFSDYRVVRSGRIETAPEPWKRRSENPMDYLPLLRNPIGLELEDVLLKFFPTLTNIMENDLCKEDPMNKLPSYA